ncbi:MAG: glycoside hydrolase family 13 protein [Bacteroidia bacterium]|nr:glycoside hydrolase family 13 protein [Bacteroidia bacterium]
MKFFLFAIYSFAFLICNAQELSVDRINPPFWWTGMKNSTLQLLVHGKNLENCKVKILQPGITVKKISYSENPDFVFVYLSIDKTAKPEKYNINFLHPKKNHGYLFPYELKNRDNAKALKKGISSSDLIYLLIPDRFANGDTANDFIPSMNEKYFCRDSTMSRHGGDLQGVMNHLDYIRELGATAIWMTPVWENNQPYTSYHGYAPTDHYKVDARLGTNELYFSLVDKAHEKGLKVIGDFVFNHIGNEHWFYKDLPSKNWIHSSDEFRMSNFRDVTLMDPYASLYDMALFSNGWFDKHMPDLNQKDSLLAAYLIQNSIWWIENSGIDGIRLDTYAYPDQQFMTNWTAAVLKEYPGMGLFGETWVSNVPNQAFYSVNSVLKNPYKPQLPGVTDFQLYNAICNALTKDFAWTDGVAALYYCLANDFLYEDAGRNIIFLDNHDVSRIYSVVHEDLEKMKTGIAFLLTTRGIPCLYYGTEILMKGFSDKHEYVRSDFHGGWSSDKINKFSKAGRNESENSVFDYISKIADYRKNNPVLQSGKLMQFVPENGVYVYFRYNKDKTVMIIINQKNEKQVIDTKRYEERINGFSKAKNIVSGEILNSILQITSPAKSALILELQK